MISKDLVFAYVLLLTVPCDLSSLILTLYLTMKYWRTLWR